MASSGQITLSTQSVDYGGGRGHITLTNVIGWSVNDNSDISFWSISSSDNAGGYWGICYGSGPYYVRLVPQVSYNGGASWDTLETASHRVDAPCTNPPDISRYVNTISMSVTLIGSLSSHHLSGDCQLRFLYYMDPTPAPSASNRYAFPNESYSEVTQVPVHVDVSWEARLRYNANGGSGAPGDQTYSESGDSHNFTVSGTVPTRRHYRFEGWSLNSGATTPSYHGGDTFTVYKNDPDKTLYAVWTKYYHPGAVLNGNSQWMSHDRDAGACQLLSNVAQETWTDLRTIDAPTGLGDPPAIYHDSKWYNQKKIGKE